MIKATYNGRYPSMCAGRLIIEENDIEIYNEQYCCTSTGSCYFTNDYSDEHVERGELIWDDAKCYSDEIQQAVKLELSKFDVCCGGCL